MRPDNEQQITDDQQPAEPLPAPRLAASIGSGHTGYYQVEATANKLIWQGPAGPSDRSELTVELQLSEDDWNTFWTELDRIHAWEWNGRDYITRGVVDGTYWQIDATDGKRTLRASGDNGYPGTQTPDPSPAFNALCRAVSKLAARDTFN